MSYRPKERSEIARNMAAIRSKNNRTEVALRKKLHALGLRFRIHAAGIIGKPDIVFPRLRIAVFVDGDYWHSRILQEKGLDALKKTLVTETRDYWLSKFQRNVRRDVQVNSELEADGWRVLRFWESDLKRDLQPGVKRIGAEVKRRRKRNGKPALSLEHKR
jgi:DNA mismatch endonuclease, patch repair protein